MSIVQNPAGLILTKGLGGQSACCSLLTAQFGVNCGCTIVIVTPPTAGGGGGSFAVEPGIYVQWPKKITPKTRLILVTVKYKDKSWRRSFIVDQYRAGIVVRVTTVINAVTARINVGVNSIKKVAKRVVAIFKNDDK